MFRTSAKPLLQELHADFPERPPGDATLLRPMLGDQKLELVRNATDRSDLEFGAAVRQVPDHALDLLAPAIEDDVGSNHRIAPRRDALFEPKIQRPKPQT